MRGKRGPVKGVSDATLTKEWLFAILIHGVVEVWIRNQRREPYLAIDINPGDGERNKMPDGRLVRGSPFIVLDKLKKERIPFNALFVERSPRMADALLSNLTKANGCEYQTNLFGTTAANAHSKFSIYRGDHADWLENELQETDAYGSLICDPNGVSKANGLPLKELGLSSIKCPNIAIILRYQYARAARPLAANRKYFALDECVGVSSNGWRPPNGTRWSAWSLDDVFREIARPNWLISEPFDGTVILAASAYPIREVRNPRLPLRVYATTSPEGRKIVGLILDQHKLGGRIKWQRP